jgi:hypothetical protein
MADPPPIHRPPVAAPLDEQALRRRWLGWIVAAVACVALLLLAFFLRTSPERDVVRKPGRQTGIKLDKPAPSDSARSAATEGVPEVEAPPSFAETTTTSLMDRIAGEPPMDTAKLLPKPSAATSPPLASTGPTGAAGMELGAGRLGAFGVESVRTSVFGVEGRGQRFVYVFDRSGSMGDNDDSLLQSAKDELLRSLEVLSDLQQFQIIFYNEEPILMRLAAQPGRLVFASDENKAVARKFLERITAGGGTGHEEALALAIKMHPDVIFFLTDADEPTMTAEQLARIRRLNDERTAIHTIEFGHGPKVGEEENFIVQLATQNGGKYRYVDVTGWGEEK